MKILTNISNGANEYPYSSDRAPKNHDDDDVNDKVFIVWLLDERLETIC